MKMKCVRMNTYAIYDLRLGYIKVPLSYNFILFQSLSLAVRGVTSLLVQTLLTPQPGNPHNSTLLYVTRDKPPEFLTTKLVDSLGIFGFKNLFSRVRFDSGSIKSYTVITYSLDSEPLKSCGIVSLNNSIELAFISNFVVFIEMVRDSRRSCINCILN